MLRSAWRSLSANSLQLVLNGALGLAVFLLLARRLDKTAFGTLNGLLAFLLLSYNVLSFGIDQLLVRKTAAGAPAGPLLATGLLHNALWSGLFCGLLLLTPLLAPTVPLAPLLLLSGGKGLLFIGSVFRNIATGQERFRRLLFMSIASNIAKTLGLLLLPHDAITGLAGTASLFAVADALEALSCVLLYGKPFSGAAFRAGLRQYRGLLSEAGPQLGTVLFAALLARFDWLLLAAWCPAATVAEYSFAYKAFELAQLPLLVIAPLLVPRFTRLLQSGSGLRELRGLLRTELLLALLSVLLLNAFWTPFADWISGGKYGAACRNAVWLLSLALPILYYNNYLWSLHFAAGRTGFIFRIFALTFAVNAGANLLLIPLLQKEGAAVAFSMSLLVQTVFYHVYARPEWRGRILRRREATGAA